MLLKSTDGTILSIVKARICNFKEPKWNRREKYDIYMAKTFGRRFDDADIVRTYEANQVYQVTV